jgi:hypothetical protein
MSVFTTYLQLGFWHIWSWQATDHLTFLLALCAPFVLAEWRRVVALVTSFTIGHSLTLALATLGLVGVNKAVIEALIPVTIMFTALLNMKQAGRPDARPTRRAASVIWAVPNALALAFGLIHGLGFSNYLRSLLGENSRPVAELLSFNLGVELGQLPASFCCWASWCCGASGRPGATGYSRRAARRWVWPCCCWCKW